MIKAIALCVLSVVLVERNVSEPDLLRGFAFSSCLAEGYKDANPALAKDAEHVAEAAVSRSRFDDAGRDLRAVTEDGCHRQAGLARSH